ncbi:STAS domain-containing protein [Amycolatopsis acidiphila]|uniref:STAS domain-containing protein n=1 Tax=Amycolatopsis acidiphila TaxID=715473 RepID=UPI0016439D85|nr:STAS domain-containing protein [Amycolatopsis acidiphila]UIJ62988.1 STAS domain-containing protein [Amycolatopsis acidiphila]
MNPVPCLPGSGPQGLLTVATRTPADGIRVIIVAGEIDAHSVAPLRAEVASVTSDFPPGGLVLDLSAVTFISAAGLEVLGDVLDQGSSRGHAVRVVASTRAVLRVFDLVGLQDPAIVHGSLAAALASLR